MSALGSIILSAALVALIFCGLVGCYIAHQKINDTRPANASRFTPKQRCSIQQQINARWSHRFMPNPYAGSVPPVLSKVQLCQVRVDADLEAHVAEVKAQRDQALAAREAAVVIR